jgi:hypothetical protein
MEAATAPRSIDSLLAGLETDDLARRADDLRELQDHPGWVFLQELVAVHVAKIERQMVLEERRVLDVDGLVKRQGAIQAWSGTIRGLLLTAEIVDKVDELAARVAALLLGDDDREDGRDG